MGGGCRRRLLLSDTASDIKEPPVFGRGLGEVTGSTRRSPRTGSEFSLRSVGPSSTQSSRSHESNARSSTPGQDSSPGGCHPTGGNRGGWGPQEPPPPPWHPTTPCHPPPWPAERRARRSDCAAAADGPPRTPAPSRWRKAKPARMPPAVGPVPVPRPELGGRWRKDRARSDSMDPMCEVRGPSPFSLPA